MRQAQRDRRTPFERLLNGDFQVRLAVLLAATLLAVFLITVLT